MARQRGLGQFVPLFLLLMTMGAAGVMVRHDAAHVERALDEGEAETRDALRQARRAMLNYMLLRAENRLEIASGISGSVGPRRLMLPCPDTFGDSDEGDENLDGTQEGSCRALPPSGINVVNSILRNGSRFGRLPWRTRNVNAVEDALSDGVDFDVRDAAGNRLWYVLSRNMAPALDGKNIPLNLHRLATRDEEWLTVYGQNGVVSSMVAAVILAPGPALRTRMREGVLITASLNYRVDVDVEEGLLAPERFFEAHTITAANTVIANYDRNGLFVQAPRRAGFNDSLAYLDMNELADGRRAFAGRVRSLMGASDVHNAPSSRRPLANVAAALAAYRAMFGFYPPPARRDVAAHLSERQRHCSRFHSGEAEVAAVLPAGTAWSSAGLLTVRAAAADVLPATVTLARDGAFLLWQRRATVAATATVATVTVTMATVTTVATVTVTLATVLYDDGNLTLTLATAALTLARYARVTLPAGAALVLTAGEVRTLNATVFRLSAAARVTLPAPVHVALPRETPLSPRGHLQGWVGEHALAHRIAGENRQEFVLEADTRAMFWSPARLTTAGASLALAAGDVLTLVAGGALRLEENAANAQTLAAVINYRNGGVITVQSARPTPHAYDHRQFVVWLLADMVRARSVTVAAPAVLFPWREKITDANSRDNLHAYPPCLDARDFFDYRFETMLEDQTMFYAVAEECHYGGEPDACGARGGFAVTVAAGATVALPRAYVLNQNYTVTVGNVLTLTLQNGAPTSLSAAVTLGRKIWLPVLDGAGATLASFPLTAGRVLENGVRLEMARSTPMIGGARAVIENVAALLIYSPAPLSRVACAAGMPAAALAGTLTLAALPATITLANQRAAADDITPLCYWLDDEENADGDAVFIIRPPPRAPGETPRNDYFVLFGGRLTLG